MSVHVGVAKFSVNHWVNLVKFATVLTQVWSVGFFPSLECGLL